MLQPATMAGLVAAVLALASCGADGSALGDGRDGTGSDAAGGGGTGGDGGMGGGGTGVGGIGGGGATNGPGGIGGGGGADHPLSLAGQGYEAYCMKLGECDSSMHFYQACIATLPDIDLMGQSMSSECDALVGSYFICLSELACEDLMQGASDSCDEVLETSPLEDCSSVI